MTFRHSMTLHVNIPIFNHLMINWSYMYVTTKRICLYMDLFAHIRQSFEKIVIPHFPRFGITISGKCIPRKACTESQSKEQSGIMWGNKTHPISWDIHVGSFGPGLTRGTRVSKHDIIPSHSSSPKSRN